MMRKLVLLQMIAHLQHVMDLVNTQEQHVLYQVPIPARLTHVICNALLLKEPGTELLVVKIQIVIRHVTPALAHVHWTGLLVH